MQQPIVKDDSPRLTSDLSAYSSDVTEFDEFTGTSMPKPTFLENFLLPIISTSLMITGNTVGAGMLVLPDLAAGPGMGVSSAVLVGAWFMNLLSGLAIAQVAIQQHDSSGIDAPSSFKEFAETNLPSADDLPSPANLVSGTSIFVNALVLAFDTSKAGQVGGAMVGLDGHLVSYAWAAALVGLVSTLSLGNLSKVASFLVMGLFASFAGLLLPGLAHVADPLTVLASPPDASVDVLSSVLHMLPVIITTLTYQNIVPTITRILDYDRTKVTAAITLGSVIPLCIYLAWCVAVLGGGIDTGLGGGLAGPLMTIFSIVTVGGSSIGALVSLSEEFEIILGQDKEDTFSLPSVALPVSVSLLACQVFASDINGALKVAGSFGSPLLYGLIPVAMAFMQQQKTAVGAQQGQQSSVVPGGMCGLGVLGLGATGLVGFELAETLGTML
jgi:tyrosine-specific transport protein